MRNKFTRTALSSKGYLQVNKLLAREVGLTASMLLAELVWQEELAHDKGTAEADGFFPAFRAELERQTTLSPKLQRAAEKDLESVGMLTTRVDKAGGNQLFYRLNQSAIARFFQTEE